MATADIYLEHAPWKRPLLWSLGLHGGLCAFIVLYTAVFSHGQGQIWGSGGGGDAMSAMIVSNIPLPASEQQTQNVLANESKGLSQSQPKVVEQEPEAIAIPDRDVKKHQKPSVDKNKPQPEPESNQVPYGEGGPVHGPYAAFNAGGAQGGFSFSGGTGDFGSRFSWYVQVVQRKVSENWMKYEVDPSVRDGRRVYITFEVPRNGTPRNVQIEQSSGIPSLDYSAVRAIQRIDTFGPLPSDYSGGSVGVEFWFEYKK
jgi:periplasmic protein TonB